MRRLWMACLVGCSVLAGGVLNAADEPKKPAAPTKADDSKVIPLFDGKTLKGWQSTNFGGEGDVTVEDGNIIIDFGSDLSGITWQKEDVLPKSNYEISLEAKRIDGGDFFVGLTFPVKDSHCSLIMGGWGGGVCGLSSIDGNDASENATTLYREFKTGQWYKVRLVVLDERIRVWVDGKEIIDANIKGKKIGIRGEVELSKPLGFATWRTKGAIKSPSLKKLDAAEIAEANKK